MTALFFSTEDEAAPFLQKYEQGRFEELTAGDVLYDDHLLVSITGTGLIKTTLRTERVLRHYASERGIKRVVHAGFCTALGDTPLPGEVVGVSQVLEGDRIEMAAPRYPRMPLDMPFAGLKAITLVTQNHVLEEAASRTYWSRIAQATDVAGYAVAFVTGTYGLPCHLLKAVAGSLVTPDANVRETREAASTALATTLLRVLPAL